MDTLEKKIYERAIESGHSFEFGFKEKFIHLLLANPKNRDRQRFERELIKIESVIDYLLNKKDKEDNKQYIDLGRLACESIINSLFTNKELNPDFVGRLAEPEKDERTWENADLLFVQDDTLYVFELTLLRSARILEKLKHPESYKNKKDGKIELSLDLTGPNIEVGYYKENLNEVVDDILKVFKDEEQNKFLLLSVAEYLKLTQALEYAYLFLLKGEKNYSSKIKKVFVSTLYPLYEGLKMFFKVENENDENKVENENDENKKGLEEQLHEIEKLRDSLKPKFKKAMEDLREILKREGKRKPIILEPKKPIGEIRNEVSKIVLSDNTMGNITALCHPAGTGKTTAILNKVIKDLKENNAVLLLYFVPRIKIAEDKKAKTKQLLEKEKLFKPNETKLSNGLFGETKDDDDNYIILSNDDIRNADEKISGIENEKFKDIFYQIGEENQKGLLKSFHEIVYEKMEKEGKKPKFIGIFTTLQSIVTIEGENTNTFKNAIFLARYVMNKWNVLNSKDKDFNINGVKIYIVLDEILADDTGLYKLNIITKGLEKTFSQDEESLKDHSKVYILDANFGSGKVLESVLYRNQEYIRKGINFVPPSIFKVKGKDLNKEKYDFHLDQEKFGLKKEWKVIAYGMPGFVGNKLVIIPEIRFFEYKDLIIKTIAKIIINEKERCLLYMQDKDMARRVKEEIEKHMARRVKEEIEKHNDKKVAIITSNMDNREDKNESFDNYDVVISTSSISRGVDVPRRKIYVFIYENSPVSEVAELYQALSRGRGIKDEKGNIIDDQIDREVHILLYKVIPREQIKENIVREIEANIPEVKELRLIERAEDIYKAKKILQLEGFLKLIESNLEAYIDPKDDKEYFISITGTQQPNLSVSYLTQLKELDEIAKIVMPKKNNKTEEIATLYTYITNKESLFKRKLQESYPFALIETYKYVSVNIKFLEDLKNVLEKEGKRFNISDAKLNEYISFINSILSFAKIDNNREKVNIHIGKEYALEYLPAKLFRDSIANQEYKLLGRYITRSGLVAVSDVVKVSEKGDFVISITGGFMNMSVFNPKVPLEIFLKEDLLEV